MSTSPTTDALDEALEWGARAYLLVNDRERPLTERLRGAIALLWLVPYSSEPELVISLVWPFIGDSVRGAAA